MKTLQNKHKVLSWNLYNFYDYDYFLKEGFIKDVGESKNFISQRLKYFTEKIKEINPDICYFYEVGDIDLLKKMFQNIFEVSYFFETSPDRRGIRNVVVSKIELSNQEVFLSDLEIPNFVISEGSYKNKYLVQKRGYIKTSINNLNIYAVHLKSQLPSRIKKEDGEDYEIKNSVENARAEILGELIGMAESYSIRKIFSEDINSNKSIIAIGDFNADSYSKRLKILRGLRDSDDEMLDMFKAEDLSNYSNVYRGNRVRLDHAVFSRDISENIINPIMMSDCVGVSDGLNFVDTKIIGSDHAPIIFEIEL
jgi:endonuclease/exonuclease/phosphatase family metal-dependent hydrolase